MTGPGKPVTIPASHEDEDFAPGQIIPVDDLTGPDPTTAESIRAHLLRLHNRPQLLGTTEKP